MVTDTNQTLGPLAVYFSASTGNVTTDPSEYLATVELKEGPNFAPEFTSTLRRFYVIDWAGEMKVLEYTIPDYTDKNGEEVELEVSGYKDVHFINYSPKDKKFTFKGFGKEDEGRYTIDIALIDKRDKRANFEFNVDVMNLTGKPEE